MGRTHHGRIPCGIALALAVVGALSARASARTLPQQGVPAQDVAPARAVIEAAVERAVAWLLTEQMRDGSWGYECQRYPTGQAALSAYALLEAGLPVAHPAVARALSYLEADLPAETYALGTQMMVFTALRDERYRTRLRSMTERILATELDGDWGYPLTHADPVWIPKEGRADLSNTQYAVLGLRAAAMAGVEVPRKVWFSVLERTLSYQQAPRAVEADKSGRKSPGRVVEAGFRYVADGSRGASGSMTAAGLTILGCVRQALGADLDPRRARQIATASEQALRWLGSNWSVDSNPGEGGWLHYYLYGLERVGATHGIERIGEHAWFAEGAAQLLKSQAPNGSWGESQPDTCFAILFLERATSSVESGPRTQVQALTSADADLVQLLGTRPAKGVPELTVWLGPPTKALRERYPGPVEVEAVIYTLDGEPAAEVDGEAGRAWESQRFPARLQLTQRGNVRVGARVALRATLPQEPAGGATVAGTPVARDGLVEVESKGFEVVVDSVLEDWMLAAAQARTRNVLKNVGVKASASTQISAGEGAAKACDGLEGTRWLAAAGDAEPWIRLEFDRPVKADRVVITHATQNERYRGERSRATEAQLFLNREAQPLRVRFEEDEMRPTAVDMGRTVTLRSLELRLTARAAGRSWPDQIGLAEIGLESDASDAR